MTRVIQIYDLKYDNSNHTNNENNLVFLDHIYLIPILRQSYGCGSLSRRNIISGCNITILFPFGTHKNKFRSRLEPQIDLLCSQCRAYSSHSKQIKYLELIFPRHESHYYSFNKSSDFFYKLHLDITV